MDLLFEWQATGNFGSDGILPGGDFLPDDEFPEISEYEFAAGGSLPASQEKKKEKRVIAKVSESEFTQTLRHVKEQSFKWIIDVLEHIDFNRANAFILDSIRNESNEGKMKQMYAKVDGIVKPKLV